ncbi:hypothetical protein FQZ97_770260 [compost metagenome]
MQAGDEARQHRDEQRAQHGAGDVLGQHAATFGRGHAVLLSDDHEVALAAHREGGAHGLALDAQQQRQRQAQRQGAQRMAELLEQQRPAGLLHLRQRGTDREAQLHHEQQQARVEQAAGQRLLRRGHAHHARHAPVRDAPGGGHEQRPQHRQQHHLAGADAELRRADEFGHGHEDQGDDEELEFAGGAGRRYGCNRGGSGGHGWAFSRGAGEFRAASLLHQ